LPEPNAGSYAQVYRAISDAIHAGNPDARVAVGGLSGIAAGCCISGLRFTESLITSGVPMDAVALHPYPSNGHAPDVHLQWKDNFDDIGAVRQLLDGSGLSQVEVWVTEWGWSSEQVGGPTQATYMLRSLEMLRDQFPYVAVATAFLDADRPGYDFGLLTASFEPKSAGAAFAGFQRTRLAAPQPPPSPPSPSTSLPRSAPDKGLNGTPPPSAPPAAPSTQPGSASAPNAPGGGADVAPAPPVPIPTVQEGTVALRLLNRWFSLSAETARAGKAFGATMRVVRSDTGKPLVGGRVFATAAIAGKRLRLVGKGWRRPAVAARWLVPVWAKGKRITGSITVRYRGATITKRFSAPVR
jgi:hypothetical protein